MNLKELGINWVSRFVYDILKSVTSELREWNRIFDLGYEELHDFENQRRPFEDEKIYIQALRAYYQRDLNALRELIAHAESRTGADWSELLLALKLRLSLLEMTAPPLPQTVSGPWSGEIAFLQARTHELRGELPQAVQQYQIALKAFQTGKSPRKAIKSAFNAIVLELAQVHTPGRTLVEFQKLVAVAEHVSEFGVMIQAAQNLAWELERIGARKLGIRLLQNILARVSDRLGNYDRISAHALLYDFLLQEGRTSEAEYEEELVLAAPFAEIHGALAASKRAWINRELPIGEQLEKLNTTWRARWGLRARETTPQELAEVEQRTIEVLLQGPLHRDAFIEAIFRSGLPVDVELARFKRHLTRLRTKTPNLIAFKDNLYQIVPNPHLHTQLSYLLLTFSDTVTSRIDSDRQS